MVARNRNPTRATRTQYVSIIESSKYHCVRVARVQFLSGANKFFICRGFRRIFKAVNPTNFLLVILPFFLRILIYPFKKKIIREINFRCSTFGHLRFLISVFVSSTFVTLTFVPSIFVI